MKSVFTVKILLLILFSTNLFSQYTNFRLHPSDGNQIEPSISKHPANPNLLFASAFTIRSAFLSEGIYVSTNGGITWTGNDTCSGAPTTNHGGDPGPIIDKNGIFILTHQGGFFTGMYSNNSTDLGSTWSNNLQIAANDQNKGSPGTDDVAASPFYGRTYLVWTRFLSPFPIVVSYTSNSGSNWTAFSQINSTPAGHYSLGANVVVGPNGNVYVTWSASLNISPFTEDFIGFAVSTNGGVSWTVNENIFDCNGIRSSSLAPWGIRVNGFPLMDVDKTGGSRNGWIYIVTAEKNLAPAGSDADIVFHRSTNGGTNWSAGVRVNQDALNNGRVQFFPAITVDNTGGINVVYYDNRNTSDSMEVYISRSTDGGNTWTDVKVSDHRFYPRPVSGSGAGNMGDNIGITNTNGKLLPVWMSDKSGTFQIWSAIVDINLFGIKNISTEIPEKFQLEQNYPNPFNPKTIINFKLRITNYVSLKVYDMLGKEVMILVNQKLEAGTYEVDFDGSNFASGVYYYKIVAGDYTETKKMVLSK